MKSTLVLLVVAAVAVGGGWAYAVNPLLRNYHKEVGIPAMERIRKREQGVDFDGSRIGGGAVVPAGTQPHLGGIIIHFADGRQSMCGASLLSHTRALTAAHCWISDHTASSTPRNVTHFTMVYGSSFLTHGGVRIDTNQVIAHENWLQPPFPSNDIAVVIHRHVEFNNLIQPINLPSGADLNRDFVGVWAVAAGYGAIETGLPPVNPDKRVAALRVITNEECRQTFGSAVVDSSLCVSGAEGSNICAGDSGGPLAVGSGNNRVLIGVTSFSVIHCNNGQPSGFTRVTSFMPWILARL